MVLYIQKNNIFETLTIKVLVLIISLLFMGVISYSISSFILPEVSGSHNSAEGSGNLKLDKFILGVNHFLIFSMGSMLYLWLCYRKKLKSFLNFNHFPPQYLLLFPLALFTLYPTMGYLAQWVKQLNLPDFLMKLDNGSLEYLPKILEMHNVWDLVVNLFIVGVLAGVGEELLFRGIIQKEIENRIGKPHIAIWISAIIFSAMHFQVVGFIPKLLIGAILGYAYYFSGSLILPMILHFLNNSFATVSLYSMGNIDIQKDQVENNISLMAVIISLCLFSWLFFVINRYKVSQNLVQYE